MFETATTLSSSSDQADPLPEGWTGFAATMNEEALCFIAACADGWIGMQIQRAPGSRVRHSNRMSATVHG